MNDNRTPSRRDDLRRFVNTPAEYLHYKRQHGDSDREPQTKAKAEEEVGDGLVHYLFPDWLEYIGRAKPPP